jgi:hypothetical protein
MRNQGNRSTDVPLYRLAAAAALCCAVLAGCIVAPARPGYYSGELVTVAPPPAQEEVIGVAPAPGYFWIGGYWGWSGGRHEWVRGHWEAPRAGYAWVPHRWEREERGWRMHEGHWERR